MLARKGPIGWWMTHGDQVGGSIVGFLSSGLVIELGRRINAYSFNLQKEEDKQIKLMLFINEPKVG